MILNDKVKVMFLSFILTITMFVYNQQDTKNVTSNVTDGLFSTKGVYVINNIDVEYLYDKENYEVIPFVSDVYAVIKGDKGLINVQKWSGKPKFYIDLRGKPVGIYNEKVQYEGVDDKLEVEIYPKVIDVKLVEQQIVRFKPIIELEGVEKIDKNYIVSVPVLLQDEVKVKGTQEMLANIGVVKGVVDVSDLKKTSVVEVPLKVYDRENKEMNNILLLDKYIKVQIPIEKKVTIIKEEVVKNIVIQQEVQDVKKEGTLSFTNIPEGYKLTNLTSGLTFTKDVKIDVSKFGEGVFEITLNDNGKLKVVKFELVKVSIENNNDIDKIKDSTEKENISNDNGTSEEDKASNNEGDSNE